MKIREYQTVLAVTEEDVFILDGENGTRNVTADVLAKSLTKLTEDDADQKIAPEDADTLPLFDSAADFARKKITVANFILDLKERFSTVFAGKTHSHTASDVGAVPDTRTVNGKRLNANLSLTSSDVGAVPDTRTVNGKRLNADITLASGDVGAVPNTRTVNGKALSSDISLSASDVGALGSNAAAVSAAKLTTARSLQVDLGSESGASFDGTAGVEPGVKGILLPPHGGIGSAAEMHRMIFRGKNLGTSLTAAQKTAIQNGTFTDLWLGDYWVIGGVNWRIVDFDYWWNCGDTTAFTKHHLVIMPDTNLGDNKQMNTTNTTDGGYVGSLMHTSNMNDAKAKCTAAFGSNILSHRDIFCNAVTNGRPTGYAWLDSTIELPTEVMIYGCPHYAVMNDGTSIPMKYAISKSQLALFAVAPKFITIRQNYWLQDVVSAALFAGVNNGGNTTCTNASYSYVGVRPVFPVGVS